MHVELEEDDACMGHVDIAHASSSSNSSSQSERIVQTKSLRTAAFPIFAMLSYNGRSKGSRVRSIRRRADFEGLSRMSARNSEGQACRMWASPILSEDDNFFCYGTEVQCTKLTIGVEVAAALTCTLAQFWAKYLNSPDFLCKFKAMTTSIMSLEGFQDGRDPGQTHVRELALLAALEEEGRVSVCRGMNWIELNSS